jgi:hypothetical protein
MTHAEAGAGRHGLLILGTCFTPIALIIGFASGGGGHGSYWTARVILPSACPALGSYPYAALVVSSLSVAQWLVCGWVLD